MPEYYQNLVTDKSFKLLQQLNSKYKFILIGGWAVFFYTHSLKSKDIDVIIDFNELDKLKENYEVFKNERLKKYEIVINEIDIDIYLPFYSKFCLSTEVIQSNTRLIEGFKIPSPEILLLLKQQAYQERRGSSKGEKDKIDILSLLSKVELDFDFYKKLIDDYELTVLRDDLISLLKETNEVKELNLKVYGFSQLRKKIIEQLK